MAELASLQIKVVRDGIEQAQKALNDLAKAADNAEKSSGGVTKGFEDSGKKTRSFAGDVMAAGKMIGAAYIAKQIGDIGIACLKAAADMEQQKVAFTTMLGSAEKANTLLRDMTEFAAKTPFELPQIVDAGKRMLAFGYAQEEIIDNLRIMGDIAAGLSMPVGDLVYLMGGIKAQGKAMTVDLMQFANRGLPIYEELAKVLKISTGQVKDFASQGKIGFKDVEQAFKNLTSEGGKFAGLMDAQAGTLGGKWSNLNDALGKTAVIIGDEMAEPAGELVTLFTNLINKINEFSETNPTSGGKAESIGIFAGMLKDLNSSLDGTWDTLRRFDNLMSKDAADDMYNRIRAWEATSGGVTSNMQKIFDKYGDVNGAAGIYRSYLYGQVKLTDDQVKSLETIIEKQKDILDGANPITEAYGRMNKSMQGFIKDTYGNKDLPKTPGSGKDTWAQDQKTLHDLMHQNASDIDKINMKHAEEMSKIQALKEQYARNASMQSMANKAAISETQNYIDKLDEATRKANSFGNALAKALGYSGEKGKVFASVMDDLLKNMASASINAVAQSFEKIGEALGKGEMSGKAMKKIMAEMVWQIIEALPMMFVAAGVNLIAQGGIPMLPVGLSLIGMGLAGQIGVGYVNGLKAKKEAEAQAATETSAFGNVYGFAQGGTFSNEIVNSPTRFMFRNGGSIGRGLMGEAGTEAVVPLRRMSNGNLGVESSGGGEVNVTIINGSGEPVNVKKEKGSNGGQDITVTVGAIVSKQLADGTYDSAFRARYGLNRRGV